MGHLTLGLNWARSGVLLLIAYSAPRCLFMFPGSFDPLDILTQGLILYKHNYNSVQIQYLCLKM